MFVSVKILFKKKTFFSYRQDKEASTDINGNDDDPSPRYEPTDENK